MDIGQTIQLLILVGCLLPIVSVAVIGVVVIVYGRRWLDNITAPDIQKLLGDYQAQVARNPQADRQALIGRIIRRQALMCGLVGFITGLGGFTTLVIALPIDLALSTRYQASMIHFIAHLYGYSNDRESRVAAWMIMAGSGEVSQMSVRFVMAFMLRLMGKSFSKFVPVIGAVTSFIVNYLLAQSTGYLALRWYAAKYERNSATTP